ncbi:MAG: glycerate kinase [Burkholderiaceae bacterium]|nr:glycerate kinase [Burkholderiaceae bacterium]
MRIVIAPDSFKESLSAVAVAQALAAGVKDVIPDAEIVCVPMADGGEGSLDVVLTATSGQRRTARVVNANGEYVSADWGWLGQGSAFIEMAAAAGLEQIPSDKRLPLTATTYGVGQLIIQALDAGARRIMLALGGSATTDGGAGLLQALGAQLLDKQGNALPYGGAALQQLDSLSIAGLDPRLAGVDFQIAIDVDNTLCGSRGAAAIFGPQKGATPDDVAVLDAGLSQFADVCARYVHKDERNTPGMGAAGGLGFAISSFFNAKVLTGVDLVAGLCGLDDALRDAQLVLTGEGRMDAQTMLGKTPVGVARYAGRHGIPVVAIVGSLGDGYQAVYGAGISAAFSLVSGPMSLEQAMASAPLLLRQRAADCLRLWLSGRQAGQTK